MTEMPQSLGDGSIEAANNDTPDVMDGDDSLFDLSLSRRQGVAIGLAVGLVVVVLVLRYRSNDGDGGVVSTTVDEDQGDDQDDENEESESFHVEIPHDTSDPLAADEALVAALKDAGRLSGKDNDE